MDVVFNWDVGKNDSLECGGEKWTSVMSQKMDHLQKEAKTFCDWKTKREASIAANDSFEKWLKKRNLALRPIQCEIYNNT